jgi:ABC transporter DrrB family efflux protein
MTEARDPLRPRPPLVELTIARLRMYVREPEALFWTFGFPILMAIGLGIAFARRAPEPGTVDVEDGPEAAALVRALAASPDLDVHAYPASEARDRLRTGKVALVVAPGGPGSEVVYRYDPSRPEGRLARALTDAALQRASGRHDARATRDDVIVEPGARYIDFLIPGLIGMNLMSASMWGVAWTIVYARTKKLLKRLAATPMRRRDFLLSQMIARLALVVTEVGVPLGFGWIAFSVALHGSVQALACVSIAGVASFSGLGLLVASRARSTEVVSGLMNLAMLPMFVLSGVFFSSARFPAALQPVIRLLPLTALNDALRAVITDGAPLAHTFPQLAVLLVWAVVCFALALRWFRWS